MVFKKTTCVMLSALMLGSVAATPVYTGFSVLASAEEVDVEDYVTKISGKLNGLTEPSRIVSDKTGLGAYYSYGDKSIIVAYLQKGSIQFEYPAPVEEEINLMWVSSEGVVVATYFGDEDLSEIFYKDTSDYDKVKESYNINVGHVLYFYAEDLPPKIFELPADKNSCWADDQGNICYMNGKTCGRVNIRSGEVETLFEINSDHAIKAVNPDDGVFVDYQTGKTARAMEDFNVKNIETGEIKWTKPFYSFNAQYFYSDIKFNPKYLMTYGTGKAEGCMFNKPIGPVRCYDKETGEFKASFRMPDGAVPLFSERSDYGLITFSEPCGETAATFFDPATGKCLKINSILDELTSVEGHCITNDLWIVKMAKGEVSSTYIVDLSKPEFSDQLELIPEVSTVGPGMEEIGKRSEELEKKYDIQIFLGDELNDYALGDVTSGEAKYDDERRKQILEDLDTFDEEFGRYP